LLDCGLLTFLRLLFLSRAALLAENLFLRKQLALFQDRRQKPRRTTAAVRLLLLALARWFDWRGTLVIVQPATFIKWHRTAFRMLWRWKSNKRGRPPLPTNLRDLIREMSAANPTWGEERIAHELLLKLGVRVSPRTVRKYLSPGPRCGGNGDQRWSTFVRNHAKSIVSCDFLVSVSATFRVYYVFVAMEVGSRRFIHYNVTRHPTAEWTVQQFREFLAFDHPYRFLLLDRDCIGSSAADQALKDFGIRVLKSPVHTPTANAFCERISQG
jgi:putative transposase